MTHNNLPQKSHSSLDQAAPHPLDLLAKSVLRVGDGRGFVVEATRENHIVITAAHCLPRLLPLPPPHPGAYMEELTRSLDC
jgi:hypothetical protein